MCADAMAMVLRRWYDEDCAMVQQCNDDDAIMQ